MRYEIRIDGPVPAEELRATFPELQPSVQSAETLLSGPVADEEELYALLMRFQELGLHVTEFRRISG